VLVSDTDICNTNTSEQRHVLCWIHVCVQHWHMCLHSILSLGAVSMVCLVSVLHGTDTTLTHIVTFNYFIFQDLSVLCPCFCQSFLHMFLLDMNCLDSHPKVNLQKLMVGRCSNNWSMAWVTATIRVSSTGILRFFHNLLNNCYSIYGFWIETIFRVTMVAVLSTNILSYCS